MAARGRPQPAGSSPQVQLGSSLGGPYLGVHLRRKDFIWGHRQDVPSLDGAVRRIRSLMEAHQLPKVFVATDAVRKGRPAARGGGPALPGAVPGPAQAHAAAARRAGGAQEAAAGDAALRAHVGGAGALQGRRRGHHRPVDLRARQVRAARAPASQPPPPPRPGRQAAQRDVGALGLVRLSAWGDSLCFQMLRHAGVWAWAPVLQVAGARPEKGPGRGPVLLRS